MRSNNFQGEVMYARIVFRFGTASLVACVALISAGCSTITPVGSLRASQRMTAPREARGDTVDLKLVAMKEVDLVEAVAAHRNQYRASLERLHAYYSEHGYAAKQGWASYELDGLSKVKPFRYLMDSEVPTERLHATDSIPEADALFEEGRDLMKRGGYGVPGIYREDRMIQAAEVLRRMILQYPSSDKIGDAAFLCGEIHKEYLPGQEQIAVKWYERCWIWDPETTHPAKFQAAVVYDYRLHDRDAALELYHRVVSDGSREDPNVRHALKRIQALTGIDPTSQAALPVNP